MLTCPYCAREIPPRVTVCPCCRSKLPNAGFRERHGLIAVAFGVMLLFCLSGGATFAVLLSSLSVHRRQPLPFAQTAGAPLVVEESRVVFGQCEAVPMVVVLGTLRNTSGTVMREPVIQVEFFDAAGRLSDVGEVHDRPGVIPPGASVAFKVSRRREFDASQYATHRVWVRGMARSDGEERP